MFKLLGHAMRANLSVSVRPKCSLSLSQKKSSKKAVQILTNATKIATEQTSESEMV